MTLDHRPSQPVTPKERSSRALVLAILLHLLIAIVVYFAIFHNRQDLDSIKPIPVDINPLSKSTDSLKSSQEELLISDNNTVPDNENTKSQTTSGTTGKNQSNTDNDSKLPISKVSVDSIAETQNPLTTIKPQEDNLTGISSQANNENEYKLQQTEEYKKLDAEIDKENEKLSNLIGEIKNRNQAQIQQHHSPKSNADSIQNNSSLAYDYPITPITEPPVADSKKSAVISDNER